MSTAQRSTRTPDGRARVLMFNEPFAVPSEYLEGLGEVMEITRSHRSEDAEHGKQIAELIEQHGPFLACIWHYSPVDKTAFPTLNEATVSPLIKSGTKYMSTFGAGYNHVSLPYLNSQGVTYANNPICAAVRTADSTASMILSALRGSWGHDREIRKGGWVRQGDEWVAKDARKCTLGIVGMGRIGKMVADHMSHFGMRVVYSSRRRLPEAEERSSAGKVYTHVLLDELYAQADVISLHCPLTEETTGMINDEAIAKMKDGVILINTARGPVIDEPALLRHLSTPKILRVALDVFPNEPNVHPDLIASEKTLLLPHIAVVNETMSEDMQMEIMRNLEAFVRTGKPHTPVLA